MIDLTKWWSFFSSLNKGQESLQKTFDSKLEKLRNDVLSTIDDKINLIKVDMNLQFAGLRSLRSESGTELVDTSVNNSELTVIATNEPVRHDRPVLESAIALILLWAMTFQVAQKLLMWRDALTRVQENPHYWKLL